MMKHTLQFILILLMSFIESVSVYSQAIPIDYLGQIPPGYFPKIFAPEIIGGSNEYSANFSPAGNEFYFAGKYDGKWTIKYMKKINGLWSGKMKASFCGPIAGEEDASPCFSPDGNKIFFISNRKGGVGDWDIWYTERTYTGWSEPKNPGSPINSPAYEDYPYLSKDGEFFFNSFRPGGFGEGDIYQSSFNNGKFGDVTHLGNSFNTSDYEQNPVVIGDKLIFGGASRKILKICYRIGENKWSMPDVISGGTFENAVYYGFRSSPDEKYFFFGRPSHEGKSEFYWVNIEALNFVGVKEAPFNYIVGWYSGDTTQMKQALHPGLAKRRVVTTSEVWNVSYDWMINAVKSGVGKIDNIQEGQKDIQILDQTDTIASIKVTSNKFIDYLHLAKVENQWKIINALWEFKTTKARGTLKGAEQTVNKYIHGRQTGEFEVLKSILLPGFAGRTAISSTEIEDIDYNWMTNKMKNYRVSSVIKNAIVNNVQVLDTCTSMASIKISYGDYVEYLHLSYISNQWYIVNSLRNYTLSSPKTK